MKKVDFDDYQKTYNELLRNQVRFFDKNDAYFAEYKVKILKKLARKRPQRILEYGCGVGRNLGFLRKHFPGSEIYGCDISGKSLESAAKEHTGTRLFALGKDDITKKFDLIFVANVMHHIAPELRLTALRDIDRMLEENGSLFIFEHNPYNPVTRHLVNTCPFDEDAVLVKPAELKSLLSAAGMHVKLVHYTLFFPVFLKWLRFLEAFLVKVPMGGQYFVYARKKGAAS
ncbi:MAG: class I SAM-dependent methyltransferase [Nitrospirota bacterium]|nr:class I SAM-dependent methyltransferase [Nitrospirota bacterium]